MKCPKCEAIDSIKVVESCEKFTDITLKDGKIVFGEMHRESEYTFGHYECMECCSTWSSTDDLINALTKLPFEIADKWGIEEVYERANERGILVDTTGACMILKIMQDNYDANIGMNWAVLDCATDKYMETK